MTRRPGRDSVASLDNEVPAVPHKQRSIRKTAGGPLAHVPGLDHALAWAYGIVLTGLIFRLRDGVWTAIIKGDLKNEAVVAFVDVGSFGRTVEAVIELIDARLIFFQQDSYPPKIYTKAFLKKNYVPQARGGQIFAKKGKRR